MLVIFFSLVLHSLLQKKLMVWWNMIEGCFSMSVGCFCRLNHRDTWRFLNSESVAGNYYPVNSRILIKVSVMMADP